MSPAPGSLSVSRRVRPGIPLSCRFRSFIRRLQPGPKSLSTSISPSGTILVDWKVVPIMVGVEPPFTLPYLGDPTDRRRERTRILPPRDDLIVSFAVSF